MVSIRNGRFVVPEEMPEEFDSGVFDRPTIVQAYLDDPDYLSTAGSNVYRLEVILTSDTPSNTPQENTEDISGIVVFETLNLRIDDFGQPYFEKRTPETPEVQFSASASGIPQKDLKTILERFYDTKGFALYEFESTRPSQRTGASETYEGISLTEQGGKIQAKTLFIKGCADKLLNGLNEAVIHQLVEDIEGVPKIVYFAEIHLPNGSVVSTMAVDYVDGENLWEATPNLSQEKKAKALYDISDRLCQYHSRGVVHCDVKPDNVLLDEKGDVICVLDFGISTLMGWPYKPLEKRLSLRGTPRYVSPEQIISSSGNEKPATDVYAFGSMALELLTEYAPNAKVIEDETLKDNVARIRALLESAMEPDRLQGMNEEERKRFDSLPDYVQELLARSIVYAPEQRPAMSEMREGFGRYFREMISVDVN